MLRAIKVPSLAPLRLSKISSASPSGHITTGSKRPWTHIGDAHTHLLAEFEQLYWVSVEPELECILFTLRTLQSTEFRDICLDDETDDFVHGFDTFVDQVSDQSRAFAKKVGERKEHLDFDVKKPYRIVLGLERCDSYGDALEKSAENAITERASSQLKADLRGQMPSNVHESELHHRAKMLLQAIGLLDIDKLIEYRPPLDNLSFWKRPAVPQLQLKTFNKVGNPVLAAQDCSSCNDTIKGCMYWEKASDEDETSPRPTSVRSATVRSTWDVRKVQKSTNIVFSRRL